MAIQLVCDGGCGKTTMSPEEFHEAGIVKKRQYCDECWPEIEKMVKATDALHTRLAKQWANGLKKVRGAAAKAMPKAELPDVGD